MKNWINCWKTKIIYKNLENPNVCFIFVFLNYNFMELEISTRFKRPHPGVGKMFGDNKVIDKNTYCDKKGKTY